MSQVEWQVLEDAPLPKATPEHTPRRPRHWALRFGALLLALTLAAVGLTRWQAERQQQRLRADIQAVVQAESELARLPMQERSAAASLLLQKENMPWHVAYLSQPYLWNESALPAPTVEHLTLQPSGSHALVEVLWPPLPDALGPISELRAYRLVDGAWRRAPYPIAAEQRDDVRLEGLTLSATPTDRARLEEAGLIEAALALRAHLQATWPRALVRQGPLFLAVDAQEFSTSVRMNFNANATTVLVNSPRFEPRNPHSRLSAEAQYRLALGYALASKLIVDAPLEMALDRPDERERVNRRRAFLVALSNAEARQWALNETEQAALRDATRLAAGGYWPFAEANRSQWASPADDLNAEFAALALLLDFLVPREGPAVLGRLAQATLDQEPTRFDLATAVETATGAALPSYEAALRDFVETMRR